MIPLPRPMIPEEPHFIRLMRMVRLQTPNWRPGRDNDGRRYVEISNEDDPGSCYAELIEHQDEAPYLMLPTDEKSLAITVNDRIIMRFTHDRLEIIPSRYHADMEISLAAYNAYLPQHLRVDYNLVEMGVSRVDLNITRAGLVEPRIFIPQPDGLSVANYDSTACTIAPEEVTLARTIADFEERAHEVIRNATIREYVATHGRCPVCLASRHLLLPRRLHLLWHIEAGYITDWQYVTMLREHRIDAPEDAEYQVAMQNWFLNQIASYPPSAP